MTLYNNFPQYDKVKSAVADGSLSKALSDLKNSPEFLSFPKIASQFNKIEETYRYLLKFMIDGFEDSGREKTLNSLKAGILKVVDYLIKSKLLKDNPGIYYSTKRFQEIRMESLDSLIDPLIKNQASQIDDSTEERVNIFSEDNLKNLFLYVLTMHGSSFEDYQKLKALIISPDTSFEVKAQIISALLIGNLFYYDNNALLTLIDIYDSEIDERVSARALVNIVLISLIHSDRIAYDNSIIDRFKLWNDSIINYTRLREVIIDLIKARDTQRISHKVQEEVMPELLKIRPDILSKMKDMENKNLENEEFNPEWEELLENSEIADKLKELSEIQAEGGDFMMLAFANLKHFPFFKDISNWFLPFNPNHSVLGGGNEDSLGIFQQLFDIEGVICNSDKYSFALSLKEMPEMQKKILVERMKDQMLQLKEAMSEKKLPSKHPGFNNETLIYIRDLYRFFKLFFKKHEFLDPFEARFDFLDIPVISDILLEEDTLKLTAELYFKNNYFTEALYVFKRLEEISESDPALWEKIGYCYERLKDNTLALYYYRKAELFNPSGLWLIKRIAVLLKAIGEFKEASVYFQKLLNENPENINILVNLAICKIKSDDLENALKHLYHAQYLDPSKKSITRALAWAELLNGNFDKSRALYDKILKEGEVDAVDYLNFGHLNFLTGNKKDALFNYKCSLSLKAGNIENFTQSAMADFTFLEKLGASKSDFSLLLEAVAFKGDLT